MTGHVAVVTGAASGVGRATAALLAAQGSHVIGVDLALPEHPVEGVSFIQGPVESADTWTMVEQTLDAVSPTVDQLVVSAAKLEIGTILDLSDEQLRSLLEVNVLGAVKALRVCLPRMVAQKAGSVVAVASVDAFLAEQQLSGYGISKGALIQLIRSVAIDYGFARIRANAVCPGAIDTPFFRRHVDAADDPEAFLRTKIARHPAGRILQPDDVARVVTFLLSDAALGMNGAVVPVDGGLTAAFDYTPTD